MGCGINWFSQFKRTECHYRRFANMTNCKEWLKFFAFMLYTFFSCFFFPMTKRAATIRSWLKKNPLQKFTRIHYAHTHTQRSGFSFRLLSTNVQFFLNSLFAYVSHVNSVDMEFLAFNRISGNIWYWIHGIQFALLLLLLLLLLFMLGAIEYHTTCVYRSLH